MFLFGALILGLMGSLHCLGMCGPLVASLSISDNSQGRTMINAGLYHGMRIVAYATLGLLPGIVGEGLQITGIQSEVSLWMGVVFIGLFLWTVCSKNALHFAPIARVNNAIHNLMRPWLARTGYSKMMALGFLNGFIPCGMTYMAMATALGASSTTDSMLFMAIFGLGTTPALLSVHVFGLFKNNLQFLVPLGYLVIGALLVYRGVFVELPLDLTLLKDMGWEVMCH